MRQASACRQGLKPSLQFRDFDDARFASLADRQFIIADRIKDSRPRDANSGASFFNWVSKLRKVSHIHSIVSCGMKPHTVMDKKLSVSAPAKLSAK
jgi:hypothetical protein